MDFQRLVAERSAKINGSGIRQVFDKVEVLRSQGKKLINLGIGQPDFQVHERIKKAACDAIMADHNGYMPTTGVPLLREKAAKALATETGWDVDLAKDARAGSANLIVTAGTSAAIFLVMQAIVNPGDEVIIPDPYFVLYPYAVSLCGGKAVSCDTYPDFKMTAARVAPLITSKTKAVLINSPSNPGGVVLNQKECDDLAALCSEKGVLLISDEIYDKFTFVEGLEGGEGGENGVFPTPCRSPKGGKDVLLIRGYGKTYGVTGWRLGYAAGPRQIVAEMTKLQQYSFVCAPAPLQYGVAEAFNVDMGPTIERYRSRRDTVLKHLSPKTRCSVPHGAFYVFVEVPAHLGQTGRQFHERALEAGVVVIPGGVFSAKDTHFRISYTVEEAELEKAGAILAGLM